VALDRASYEAGDFTDGSVRDVRPEGAGGDVPVRPSGPAESARRAESLTRAEYYEVRRAADGRTPDATPDGAPDEADAESDRGGWDQVEATDRPPAEDIRVSPERATHILDGDDTGGGHRHGTGKPGKTEFPPDWSDEKIISAVEDVARRPDQKPKHQEWNDRWVARGTRDDVGIVAVLARDGRIWTSWPTPDSPGVTKNPEEP
jgi:hypothetical protein